MLSTSLPSSYSRLDPPPTGRVDPRNDPGRPSQPTTAGLARHPPLSSSVHSPASPPSHPAPHPPNRPSVLSDSRPIPIHSNIDSQSQPNTGTTPGLHSNLAVPVSTSSEVDTKPTGLFSSLSILTSAPMPSPIPPTHPTPISSTVSPQPRSFHHSPAAAVNTPSQTKGPQNIHQSSQSSILKNLLS